MRRRVPAAFFGATMALATAAVAAENPLATPDEVALEKLAVRLMATASVQNAVADVAKVFGVDPYATTPQGRATLPGAAHEVVFAAVTDTINRDATYPHVQWLWSPAHRWFGVVVPAGKVLMPNVDNVFRIIPVDGVSHYRITATPAGPLPVQVSLQLLPSLPAEDKWSHVIQELVDTDIDKSADGSYSLTVGPEPAGTLKNHIATTQAAHFILLRDTIQDWRHETPYRITVTRLDGPPPAPPVSEADLARQAAARVAEIAPRIYQARSGGLGGAAGFFTGAANQLTSPKIREGGRWGLSASGHFHLADDEALVLTLDPIGARYMSVQLANAWLGSLDYIRHTASLNLSQVKPNEDGTVTLVIAPKDPHIANWLDTTGLHDGSIFVRWQKFPGAAPVTAQGVHGIKLVKIADLPATLPRISATQRKAQLADRTTAYQRRFTE